MNCASIAVWSHHHSHEWTLRARETPAVKRGSVNVLGTCARGGGPSVAGYYPFILVRIEFLGWSPDNRLCHLRFAGIYSDKDAVDIVREKRERDNPSGQAVAQS